MTQMGLRPRPEEEATQEVAPRLSRGLDPQAPAAQREAQNGRDRSRKSLHTSADASEERTSREEE